MKEVLVKKQKNNKVTSSQFEISKPVEKNTKVENSATTTVLNSKSRQAANKTRTFKNLLKEGQNAHYPFFTEKAFMDMSMGRIPDFESLYHSLSKILVAEGAPLSAIQFLPALRTFTIENKTEIKNFISNPETNHVIVQNDLIKIVLIRWEPGFECNIHGHAEKGCVFKVLKGKVVEKRFSADNTKRVLAQGTYKKDTIAYIDDLMGLHCVGNPFTEPAITLHMYTPGNYKPRKK
jgi:predicted metal-dependent enzyme (double-stranded beta helix superfamily)